LTGHSRHCVRNAVAIPARADVIRHTAYRKAPLPGKSDAALSVAPPGLDPEAAKPLKDETK